MADVFKPASEEELERRMMEGVRNRQEKLGAFQGRNDAVRQVDDSYVVGGDVEDWGSLNFGDDHLAVKYRVVGGNFSCGSRSLEGAPQVIGGNFTFHGELESLEGFPKAVGGDVVFINHPKPGNKPDAKRWTEADIRNICRAIGGHLTVENHYGI